MLEKPRGPKESQAYRGPAPPHQLRAQKWVWNQGRCRRTSSLPGFLREMRYEGDDCSALGVRRQLGSSKLRSLFTDAGCRALHSDGREPLLGHPKPLFPGTPPAASGRPPVLLRGTCSWSKVGLNLPCPSRALSRHSPMALVTMLTRSVISSSPTPASARAPATCAQRHRPPTGKGSLYHLWAEDRLGLSF